MPRIEMHPVHTNNNICHINVNFWCSLQNILMLIWMSLTFWKVLRVSTSYNMSVFQEYTWYRFKERFIPCVISPQSIVPVKVGQLRSSQVSRGWNSRIPLTGSPHIITSVNHLLQPHNSTADSHVPVVCIIIDTSVGKCQQRFPLLTGI